MKYYQDNWVTPGHIEGDNKHSVSATVYVADDEWDEVGNWMWENRECFAGLSVLPKDGGTHKQAPFTVCDEETYEELAAYATKIDLRNVIEKEDATDLKGEVACGGGGCET